MHARLLTAGEDIESQIRVRCRKWNIRKRMFIRNQMSLEALSARTEERRRGRERRIGANRASFGSRRSPPGEASMYNAAKSSVVCAKRRGILLPPRQESRAPHSNAFSAKRSQSVGVGLEV